MLIELTQLNDEKVFVNLANVSLMRPDSPSKERTVIQIGEDMIIVQESYNAIKYMLMPRPMPQQTPSGLSLV